MPGLRFKTVLRTLLSMLGSCAALAWSDASVSVKTQKIGESGNFVSVNAVIQNTGTDTLRNLRYVWTMDWSDHGANVVPELDWSSVSAVNKSVLLRSDYLAEVSYTMPGSVLVPGASLQLNTRLRLSDWTKFNPQNDWSYLGLKAGLAENSNVSVFSDSVKLWGTTAERVDPTPVSPKVEILTRKMQESPNTLGLEFKVKNTGNVPVTHAVATWIGQPHDGQLQPVVDWTDAPVVKVNVQDPLEDRSYVHLDLDTTVVAVGAVKTIHLRLYVPDGQVDWSKDWSYAGIASGTANGLVGAQVVGYPTTGTVVSRDTVVDGIKIKDGFVTDTANSHLVSYDLSALPGYSSRTSIPVTVQAGAVIGWVPTYSVANASVIPKPEFDGALPVGGILEISGAVMPGHKLTVAVPLPDKIAAGNSGHLQILHYVEGSWKTERVDSVANGAAYVQVTSLSPFATGITQIKNILSAGASHGLWIDKMGRPWAMGKNDKGQLGTGNKIDALSAMVPVYWPRTTKVVAVAAGLWHSLILDEDGNVWAFGDNSMGQCAQSDLTRPVLTPVKVLDASADLDYATVSIAAGDTNSYAVNVQGNVFAWGANRRLQLGRLPLSSDVAGHNVTYNEDCSFSPGKVVNPYSVADLNGVRIIAAGSAHILALDAYSKSLWSWGANRSKQQTSAYDEFNKYPRQTLLDLAHFGADTLRVGGCYAAGVGCWSHQIVMPWYTFPDQVFAGGDMSGMKLWDRRTAGNRALNLVWGDNSSGQIQAGGIAVIDTPMNVSVFARSQISLGGNHLLESWYDGYTGGEHGVVQFYPVRARGGNEKGQSVPTVASSSVSVWTEVKFGGERLHCAALAAGGGTSLSYDNVTETVYAWGGAWGTTINAIPKGASAFLEVLWPKNGDTIATAGTRPQVREWRDGAYSTYWASLVRCTEGSKGCVLTASSTNGTLKAQVSVVVADREGMILPPGATLDLTKQSSIPLTIVLPEPANAIWIRFSLLSDTAGIIGATEKIEGNFQAGNNVVNFDGILSHCPVGAYCSFVNDGKLPDGSYAMKLWYRPAWGYYGDEILLPVTEIGMENLSLLNYRKVFAGSAWGGADSFLVVVPDGGVVQIHSNSYAGALLIGSWDLQTAGEHRIGVWDLDTSGHVALGHDSLLFVSMGFRKVTNALRLMGQNCGNLKGVNSHFVNAFLSQSSIPVFDESKACGTELIRWRGESFPYSFDVVSDGMPEWPIPNSGTGLWALSAEFIWGSWRATVKMTN